MKSLHEIETALKNNDLLYSGNRVKEIIVNNYTREVGVVLEGQEMFYLVKPKDLTIDPWPASEDKTCPGCGFRTAMILKSNFKGKGKMLDCECSICKKTFDKFIKS